MWATIYFDLLARANRLDAAAVATADEWRRLEGEVIAEFIRLQGEVVQFHRQTLHGHRHGPSTETHAIALEHSESAVAALRLLHLLLLRAHAKIIGLVAR